MASIEQIKKYIDIVFEQSLLNYNKLNKSPSLNVHSREKIASMSMDKSLNELLKNVFLNEGEINLLVREVTNKLIKKT